MSGYLAYKLIGDTTKTNTEIKRLTLSLLYANDAQPPCSRNLISLP